MQSNHLKNAAFALAAAVLCACLAPRAVADDITVANLTAITGQAGDIIPVYGDLTDNTNDSLYFSTDSITLNAPATVAAASDDLIANGILAFGPSEVDPYSPLIGVDLFTIQLLGGSGGYSGNTFDLYGGTDYDACSAGTVGCDDHLGGAVFSFAVNNPNGNPAPATTPEPASWLLLGTGLLAAWFLRRRRLSGNQLKSASAGAVPARVGPFPIVEIPFLRRETGPFQRLRQPKCPRHAGGYPMRKATLLLLLAGLVLFVGTRPAVADSLTLSASGTFYSVSVDATGLDPMIPNPYDFDSNGNDIWNLSLTYVLGDFAPSGGGFLFGPSALGTFSVDDTANPGGANDSVSYSGNYVAFTTGSGSTEIDICTSVYCESDPNLANYSLILDFNGNIGGDLNNPDVSALIGSNLEFMRNFYDVVSSVGGQTELQGTPTSISAMLNQAPPPPSTVPEPPTWWLFAAGFAGFCLVFHLRPQTLAAPKENL